MPFYLLPKTTDLTSLPDLDLYSGRVLMATLYPYCAETKAEAAILLKTHNLQKTHIIHLHIGREDRYRWRSRENHRFAEGFYTYVPWVAVDKYPDHLVHLSVVHPQMVAYTPDDEHGMADRQVRLKPGRYLEKFYSHVLLELRQQWIGDCKVPEEKIAYAKTADEIETVYRKSTGFRSCMGPDEHARFQRGHPTRAYGDSDLQVAYLGPLEGATARSVVYPEKKLYSRIYGLPRLKTHLELEGYQQGAPVGAKIHVIPWPADKPEGLIIPYCDHIAAGRFTPDGEWIVLDNAGNVPVKSSQGFIAGLRLTCENCQAMFLGSGERRYCGPCEERQRTCGLCEGTFFQRGEDARCRDSHGNTVCPTCAAARGAFHCVRCLTQYRQAQDSLFGPTAAVAVPPVMLNEFHYHPSTQQQRQRNGHAFTLCEPCGEATMSCHACHTILEVGDTCRCGVPARCSKTINMWALLWRAQERRNRVIEGCDCDYCVNMAAGLSQEGTAYVRE